MNFTNFWRKDKSHLSGIDVTYGYPALHSVAQVDETINFAPNSIKLGM